MALAQQHPELLRIEPASSFFWPGWDEAGIASMFSMDCEFPEAYSFHLWESQSWSLAKDLDYHAIMTIDTTYNRIARRYVETSSRMIQERFQKIYDSNVWGCGSGVGSMLEHTVEYRNFLRQFMQQNGIRSVVDLGCGDWQFSQHIDWSGVTYIGLDIVPSIVENNQRQFGTDNIQFQRFESLTTLPVADLLVCKDVLQHLSNAEIKAFLAAIRGLYKFSLVTNDEEPAKLQNIDIDAGEWRTLRLDKEPFCEPGAVILSWTVLWGEATTRKSTYLLNGNNCIYRARKRMEIQL